MKESMKENNFKTEGVQGFKRIKDTCISVKHWRYNDTKYVGAIEAKLRYTSEEGKKATSDAHNRMLSLLDSFSRVSILAIKDSVIHVTVRSVIESPEPLVYIYVDIPEDYRGLFFGKGCINLNMIRTLVARMYSMFKIRAYIQFADGSPEDL